jgi:hypothetical protein
MAIGLRSTSRRSAIQAAAWFAVFALVPVAEAAQINYGTYSGTHVNYVNVTEDSGASEALPLFGPPTVTGNSIDFNPIGFDASSSGAGSDLTVSNLVFQITAKSGSRIDTVTMSEGGDVTLAGNVAPGSMGTAAAVFASGVLDIHEVDFVGINHISVPFSMTFNPSGGTYFLGTDGGGGPIFNTQWTGSVTLDIDAILTANGIAGDATKVSIDLNNSLAAVSQTGTSAVIEKKDFGGLTIHVAGSTAIPGPIPEPASLMLAGVGVMGLLRRRR